MMPWRDPNYWTPLFGPILAVFTAILRILYDRQESRPVRIFLEGILCGLITLAASKGISAMGLNDDWSIVIGGIVGLTGSEFVRHAARSFITRRSCGKK